MAFLQYTDGHGDGRMKYVTSYIKVSYMCLIYIYIYMCVYVRSYVHALCLYIYTFNKT